jgi:hypothetical protein
MDQPLQRQRASLACFQGEPCIQHLPHQVVECEVHRGILEENLQLGFSHCVIRVLVNLTMFNAT